MRYMSNFFLSLQQISLLKWIQEFQIFECKQRMKWKFATNSFLGFWLQRLTKFYCPRIVVSASFCKQEELQTEFLIKYSIWRYCRGFTLWELPLLFVLSVKNVVKLLGYEMTSQTTPILFYIPSYIEHDLYF